MGTHAAHHHHDLHARTLLNWTAMLLAGLLLLAALLIGLQRLVENGGPSVQAPGSSRPAPSPHAQPAPAPR
jgi:hypothetical protein